MPSCPLECHTGGPDTRRSFSQAYSRLLPTIRHHPSLPGVLSSATQNHNPAGPAYRRVHLHSVLRPPTELTMQCAATTSSSIVSLSLPCHGGDYQSPTPRRRTSPFPRARVPHAGGSLKYSPSLQWRCRGISKPKDMDSDLLQNIAQPISDCGKPYLSLADVQTRGKEEPVYLGERIREIKEILTTIDMREGDASASPYDTAWVALIPNIHGKEGPHFPSTLRWIIDHQLDDGSWGDAGFFNAYDRLLNTLACVIALKTWETSSDQSARGIEFLQANMYKLGDENLAHMLCGFEVLFPALLDMARSLNIDIPYDTPALQVIIARRDEKMKRIPLDVLHNVPTTLLFSLEGMTNKLDWDKLLQLKCPDGSFLYSVASTACAVMKTKDRSCLEYLEKIVSQCDGGVPNAYPIEIFERIWLVDRLQSLGISRYFKDEIKKRVEYVYRHWTETGLGWARNSPVPDLDDTCMGFRILRQHGYNVTADAFKNFLQGDEFFCFARETDQSVTTTHNLNRASQLAFPGEKILEDAKSFSYRYLREKQAKNELLDKWIISKDLPGEISYGLDFPWLMNLPRVEARTYFDQYGGEDDVWIGKVLYRSNKNRNSLIELLIKTLEDMSFQTTMLKEKKLHSISHDHLEIAQNQQHTRQKLLQVWYGWMVNTIDKGLVNSHDEDALLLIRALEICDGRFGLEDALSYSSTRATSKGSYPKNNNEDNQNMRLPEYIHLTNVIKSICHILFHKKNSLGQQDETQSELKNLLESNVQKFTKIILDGHSVIDINTRQTFLTIIKSFYYSSHIPQSTMNFHIGKVLFERVQ